MELDAWQKEVLEHKGNLCLCSGRQVGKSTVIAIKAGESAVQSRKTIMIIASTERQALLLFEKVLSHIYIKHNNMIMEGKDKPLKTRLKLTNGSVIYCLPTGDSGYGIRGYTIDELYADEAHFISEEVWQAVTPMLATTGGNIHLLSTPFGTEGYFYRCFHNKKFKAIHVNTEEVAKGRPEIQKKRMLEFLKDEKERMTQLQYKQEYLGEFVGGIQRFFPEVLINMILKINPKENYQPQGYLFQGIDVARMGGDDSVFISVDRINKNLLRQINIEITENQLITETARLAIQKDKEINHKKIYIDDGGLGVGVFDLMFEDQQTKNKVIAINNAKRMIDTEQGKETPRGKVLHKEVLYNNLKNLMEMGKIELFDDPRIRQSLRSIQYEISQGELRIYGNYSHITEALIRAAWCIKDESLKPYIY